MTNISAIQSVLDRINEIVATTNTKDFVVHSFENDSLLLLGSFDHSYYHELEVHFHAVSYLGLPVHGLESPQFSIASEAERKIHSHLELDATDFLFKIHKDPEFNGGHPYYVAAEKVEIVEGTVFYYMRDNLKPGERIAEWVKREK